MERIMLGILLRDRKRNTWIRQETGASDIINAIRKAKHRWAGVDPGFFLGGGHIARLSDNRWTIRATEWTPKEWTSKQGRPKTRWRNDLTGQFGPVGLRLAKHCRHLWDQSREEFLCQESIQTRQTLMMTMNGSYETTSGDCTRWSVRVIGSRLHWNLGSKVH
ncbi:unnamed protein product [Porites lobata]|uniref:Uncharacterized protein n=1 Tax=Porites lobata TaxID=104759 RepID=A0ABN8NIR6_9CNID|nr:unnamed protein product [Porites lobata]